MTVNDKGKDGVFGTRTWGSLMEGVYESTDRHPIRQDLEEMKGVVGLGQRDRTCQEQTKKVLFAKLKAKLFPILTYFISWRKRRKISRWRTKNFFV